MIRRRPISSTIFWSILGTGLLVYSSVPILAADDPANTGLANVAPISKLEALAMRLAAVATTPTEREAIAHDLTIGLDAAVVPGEQLDTIVAILQNRHGPFARSAMLAALAGTPTVPEHFLPYLSWLIPNVVPADISNLFASLSNIRSRSTVKILIDSASRNDLLGTQTAAFDALVQLSGHNQFGRDLAKWTSWSADIDTMDEVRWQTELARGQAARATLAAHTQSTVHARLIETLRDLHVATPPTARDAFLGQLLSDADPSIATLGFELVRRQMFEGAAVGPLATQAILKLLKHNLDTVRASAAILVSQLAPAGASPQLADAIASETAPPVVSALLVAGLAYADSLPPQILLHALAAPGPHQSAAVDLGFAMLRAGKVETIDARQKLLVAARTQLSERNATWSACHVLGILGDNSDYVSLVRLLQSSTRDAKLAAADTLTGYSEFVDPILAAAASDPELFDIAARVSILHRTDLAGFKTLASLPAPDPESRRRNLFMLAGLCPATDLLAASKSLNAEPVFMEGLLNSLTSENRILSQRSDPAQLKAIADGILQLARIRLELNKPDAAIAATAALPEIDEVVGDLHGLNTVRLQAWLCLGRLDEAAKSDVIFEDWLTALARCPIPDQAAEINSLLAVRYNLTTQQKEALDKATRKTP